jgi:hypothetical protein
MPVKVSDFAANRNETIESAALAVGRSVARRKVFTYIYRSKARFKPVSEIARATKLTIVRVAQEAGLLYANHVVEKGNVGRETAYKKDGTLSHFKVRILKMARDPQVAKKYPTKQRPQVTSATTVIRVRAAGPAPREITIDDVESFKLIRGVKTDPKLKLNNLPEKDVKNALKNSPTGVARKTTCSPVSSGGGRRALQQRLR